MISILLPWRSNDPHRVRAWDYNRPRWQALDVQLCMADDGRAEGPFSLTRAVNRARKLARGSIFAIYGADHIPPDPQRLAWIAERLTVHPWTAVYAGTVILNPQGTERVLAGLDPRIVAEIRSYKVHMCEGIIAVRADVWDDVGGMDENFEGWGAEDVAFKHALRALYPGGRDDGEGDVLALWHHDRHGTEELTAANNARCAEYEQAAREGRMREHLKAVRA